VRIPKVGGGYKAIDEDGRKGRPSLKEILFSGKGGNSGFHQRVARERRSGGGPSGTISKNKMR